MPKRSASPTAAVDTKRSKLDDTFEPPAKLCLSAVIWEGDPSTYTVEDDLEDYAGRYTAALTSVPLSFSRFDQEHDQFVYLPDRATSFDYERKIWTGSLCDDMMDFGAVVANQMDPKMMLHAPDAAAWPDKFMWDEIDTAARQVRLFVLFETLGSWRRLISINFVSHIQKLGVAWSARPIVSIDH